MNNKIIILSIITFLLLSLGFLAYTESAQRNTQSQNWWVVYFVNPKDESLNFIIENNSNQKNFHWEALKDENKIQEGNVEINKGNKEIVEIKLDKPENKITVKISAGDESKMIYKIFEK